MAFQRSKKLRMKGEHRGKNSRFPKICTKKDQKIVKAKVKILYLRINMLHIHE